MLRGSLTGVLPKAYHNMRLLRNLWHQPTHQNFAGLVHLGFQWHLDGDVISVTEACALVLPPQPDGQTAEHILRLILTDSCGSRIERTWRVLHADP